MSRRDFVAQSTLAAVAAVLTGCGGGDGGSAGGGPLAPNSGPQAPPSTALPLVVTLSSYPVLATVGGAARVSTNPPMALARTAAGIIAYTLQCSHAGSTVNINSNFTLRCPNHGAEYAFDGVWTGGSQVTTSLARLTATPNAAGTQVTITS